MTATAGIIQACPCILVGKKEAESPEETPQKRRPSRNQTNNWDWDTKERSVIREGIREKI